MSVEDSLKRVPYWKAVALVMVGATALMWLQSAVASAVVVDNIRDDASYPSRSEMQDARERLVRIEEKVDLLLRK